MAETNGNGTTEAAKEAHYEIPKTCKGGVVVNEGPNFKVEIQDVPVPVPKDNELLVKLSCTGLCMSDVHYMMNDWAIPPMSTFSTLCAGHEGAGVVVGKGSSVTGWQLGDRAGIKPIWSVCNRCEQCYEGAENYCGGSVLTGLGANGTYQQYVVSPANYTSPIPHTKEEVSDYVAAPIMCSASTMHRALVESGLKAGQWVVFPGGGGGVGIQGVQLAKAMGMRPVVIDAGEAKRKMSLEMGAEAFVDFRETKDVAAEVKRVCGGIGAHGVIVTAYQAYESAISYIAGRVSGVIVCVGLPPKDTVTIGGDPSFFAFRNLKVVGSLVGTMQDTARCLEYAQRGLLKQISEVRGLSQMPDSVQQLRRGEIAGRVVIDFEKP